MCDLLGYSLIIGKFIWVLQKRYIHLYDVSDVLISKTDSYLRKFFFFYYLYTNMLTCRQWWPFSSQTHHHASMAWGSDDVMTTVRWFDNTTVIVGRRWSYSLRCLAFGLLLLWNHCLSNQELKMGFYDVRIYDKTDSNNLQG